MGFFGVLTIVFIVLKLVEYIDWSWWLVISPLLIQVLISIIFFIVIVVKNKNKFKI